MPTERRARLVPPLPRNTLDEAALVTRRRDSFRQTVVRRVGSARAALAFVESVGICSTFHVFPEGLACLWEAVAGRANPRWPRRSHHDRGIGLTWELKDQLPARRQVYYGKLVKGRPVLVALDLFPAFYALVRGTQRARDYGSEYEAGRLSLTAKRIMDSLMRESPQYTRGLRAECFMLEPGKTREFERAMAELQGGLWIAKTEERYEPSFSYRWDLLERWLPAGVAAGRRLSRDRAARSDPRSLPPRRRVLLARPPRPPFLGASGGDRRGARATRAGRHAAALRRDRRSARPLRGQRGVTGPAATSVPIDAFSFRTREAIAALDAIVGRRAWVVGGALRDALTRRPAGDLDVVVPSGALGLGRALADRLGGAFVLLDAGRGVCRVVERVQVDIADFRGPDLDADLRGRDFTVNALAASVHDLVTLGAAVVEDPTGGAADLEARRVRPCGPRAFADDPVRVLRAARLGAQPGWSLVPGAEPAAREAAPALTAVSAERVRDELIALLADPGAGKGLRLLDGMGGLAPLLPESLPMRRTSQPAPHRFDVWEHSLRAVEAVDEIEALVERLDPWGPQLREHLAEALGDRLTRAEALKLAALLHDVAKPETMAEVGGRIRFIGHDVLGAERTRAIADRWRLSRRAGNVLVRLVAHHLRPMHLAQSGEITRRARYRFFRALGDEARDLLLLALADAAAVAGEAPLQVWQGAGGDVLRSLMAGMAETERLVAAPPLLRGEDVMAALGVGPGPTVGRYLAQLREAQALGRISTREEALAFLRGAAGSAPE